MKKIEAIIRPSKLKSVQQGLKDVEIPCMTVVPASGTGLQKSYTKSDVPSAHFEIDFLEDCDEVFLTGTAVEITPVTSIDNFDFKVGKITRLLLSEFNKIVKA